MLPAVTISKLAGEMPDEVDGLEFVAKCGGKRSGKERFRVSSGRMLKSNGRKRRRQPRESKRLKMPRQALIRDRLPS
jgi:hypothetical protein